MNFQCQPYGVIKTAVFSALAAHDVAAAHAWANQYAEPVNASVPEQIASANRFWRMQLGRAAATTIGARECLIDAIAANDWIRIFAEQVVPTILALGLPRQITPLPASAAVLV